MKRYGKIISFTAAFIEKKKVLEKVFRERHSTEEFCM